MGKLRRNCIKFDPDYLCNITNDPSSCVELHKVSHHVALHPLQLSNLSNSVKEILNKSVAKYNADLKGIVLGYRNVKVLGSDGNLSNDTSFIHVNVDVEFYIFKPELGSVLNGVVNKKSKDHVGCLVHQVFNVSLPKIKDGGKWLGDNKSVGNDVLFKVTFMDLQGRLPYIMGEILSVPCEDSGFSTEETNEQVQRKNTVIKFENDDEESEFVHVKNEIIEGTNDNQTHTARKKKRKRTYEPTAEEITQPDEEITPSKPKKRKKHKKSES